PIDCSTPRSLSCHDNSTCDFASTETQVVLAVGAQPRAARDGRRDFALRFPRLVGCSALLGSPPVFRTARVVLSTPLSASLTARSVGDVSATSCSIRTMFVLCRCRRAYLPRTPPFIDAKSYSGRMSSLRIRFVFFIKSSLTPCGGSRADDSNSIAGLCVRHHQDS